MSSLRRQVLGVYKQVTTIYIYVTNAVSIHEHYVTNAVSIVLYS